MAIDIVAARDAIADRLEPIRIAFGAEIATKNPKNFGQPVTDLSITISARPSRLSDNGNYNGQRIALIPIQIVIIFWNPLNEDDVQAIARAIDALLDCWEPLEDVVKPLEWQSEGETGVQGLEGRQAYQISYNYEVLK
jgi:hypothetical protein